MVAVHARAGEAGSAGRLTKRAQVLLELVVDVKNNRQAQRGGGGCLGSHLPGVRMLAGRWGLGMVERRWGLGGAKPGRP